MLPKGQIYCPSNNISTTSFFEKAIAFLSTKDKLLVLLLVFVHSTLYNLAHPQACDIIEQCQVQKLTQLLEYEAVI
jgi:hypothetical protein